MLYRFHLRNADRHCFITLVFLVTVVETVVKEFVSEDNKGALTYEKQKMKLTSRMSIGTLPFVPALING